MSTHRSYQIMYYILINLRATSVTVIAQMLLSYAIDTSLGVLHCADYLKVTIIKGDKILWIGHRYSSLVGNNMANSNLCVTDSRNLLNWHQYCW